MRRVLSAILLGVLAASVSFGQNVGPIRTGFAVVTPITAGPLALSISETLTHQFDGKIVQTSVAPSPLVTLTSMVVNSDEAIGVNTGISFLNPFDVPATVSLSLVNSQGVVLSVKTVLVGRRQQLSRFVTELFSGVPRLPATFMGQLFISSNVPVAILGLTFSGQLFTALPPVRQLDGHNIFPVPPVPSTSLTPFPGTTSIFFPQLAAGGGWASKITIANTSILPQSVRVDFFDLDTRSFGLPLSFSAPNTIIQPGGVVTFSTVR